jgi:hypothetical protein
MRATMKIITLWVPVILLSIGNLALISYLENGYQEELLSEEVLQEAVLQAKAEDALAKSKLDRSLHLLSAEAEHMTEFKSK